jgi:hypothetical protein
MNGDALTSDHTPIRVHARKSAESNSLCGERPYSPWTTVRSQVSCARCLFEIERRVRERQAKR